MRGTYMRLPVKTEITQRHVHSNLSQQRSAGDHGTRLKCSGVDSGHWTKNNPSLLVLVGCLSFMNFIYNFTFMLLSKLCVKFVCILFLRISTFVFI